MLWPRESTGCAETGSPEFPVVVITPHKRMSLGPTKLPRLLQVLLQQVHWISLEELSQQPNLDPLLTLLSLPVRP